MALILYVAGFMIYGIYRINTAQKEDAGLERSIPREYSYLFSDTAPAHYKEPYTYLSKVRRPFSVFVYSEDFEVLVYKIASRHRALKHVHFNYSKASGRGNNVYTTVFGSTFNLHYKEGVPLFGGELFISTERGSIEKIKETDTVKQYYLRAPSISIGYSPSAINDMLIVSRYANMPTPMLLSLLERDMGLYMILIAPKEAGDNIDRNILNRLVL